MTERTADWSSTRCLLPEWLQWSELSQVEARSFWVSQALGPSPADFPGVSTRSWIGSGTTGTWTGGCMACRHCKWLFHLLCHKTGPGVCFILRIVYAGGCYLLFSWVHLSLAIGLVLVPNLFWVITSGHTHCLQFPSHVVSSFCWLFPLLWSCNFDVI